MRKLYTIVTKTYGNNPGKFDNFQVEISKDLTESFEEACETAKTIFEDKISQLHIKEDAFKEQFPDNGVFKAVEFCKEDIPFERVVTVNVTLLNLDEEVTA